ncbi:Phage major capsid protein, HK97 family (fragment) [uncultured Alphaproteobacteria bacterium]|uniref:Phage major capsid protein, HK97 family n=1 Tax=uncultured Alphaproteobacteria bacterium TaxID=91750 RepID=A0A212K285_9PROT
MKLEIETRAEAEDHDDGGMMEIRAAVENFTSTANTRLASFEEGMNELRSRLDRTETALRRPGTQEQRNDGPALETRAFEAFIRRGAERMAPEEIRSLAVSPDTAGGYTAPPQFVAELLRNLVQFSPIRSVARVANTSAQTVLLPKRTGTMTAHWVGETEARTGTGPTFGQNGYPVRELACYVDVSNSLLEDSALDIAAELAFDFAEEFGKAEGTAFVNGSGPLEPAGFMQHADIAFDKSGNASTITGDGLIAMYHNLPSVYRANAVWVMNSATLATVRSLKTAQGDYLLITGGLGNAPTTTLLGRPVLEAPDMPDIAGNAYPVAFGDYGNGFRIFDRVALSVLRDPYSQATNGMTRFHARRRVAAGVAKAEAIRKLKIAA